MGTAPTRLIEGASRAEAPFEQFEQVKVTVRTPDGKVRTPCMLLARTSEARAEGLRHVASPALHGYAGMAFAFDVDVDGSFTMADTLIPLTIAFADSSGRVQTTRAMTPCPAGGSACLYASPRPYRTAVEVPTGHAASLGLEPGATVEVGGACHSPSA